MPDPEVLHRGRHLSLLRQGRWEYAARPNRHAVAVIAVTPEHELLLVEQQRIPVAARVIELPAGLVADEQAEESIIEAAGRELEEEAGYAAERIEILATAPTSPGLTDELITLVLAQGLRRISAGGGVPGENITVHRVPLDRVPAWCRARINEGIYVDHKVMAALWWLRECADP